MVKIGHKKGQIIQAFSYKDFLDWLRSPLPLTKSKKQFFMPPLSWFVKCNGLDWIDRQILVLRLL